MTGGLLLASGEKRQGCCLVAYNAGKFSPKNYLTPNGNSLRLRNLGLNGSVNAHCILGVWSVVHFLMHSFAVKSKRHAHKYLVSNYGAEPLVSTLKLIKSNCSSACRMHSPAPSKRILVKEFQGSENGRFLNPTLKDNLLPYTLCLLPFSWDC